MINDYTMNAVQENLKNFKYVAVEKYIISAYHSKEYGFQIISDKEIICLCSNKKEDALYLQGRTHFSRLPCSFSEISTSEDIDKKPPPKKEKYFLLFVKDSHSPYIISHDTDYERLVQFLNHND